MARPKAEVGLAIKVSQPPNPIIMYANKFLLKLFLSIKTSPMLVRSNP